MTPEIRLPEERRCVRCGRHESFDRAVGGWRVDDAVGEVFCLHDWDITGEFAPFEE